MSLRYKIFSTCTVEVDKDSVNNPDCHSPHVHCLIAIPIHIHNCEYDTHGTEKIHNFSQCSQIIFLCHCFSVLKLYLDNTIKGFALFASFSFCVVLYQMQPPVPHLKDTSSSHEPKTAAILIEQARTMIFLFRHCAIFLRDGKRYWLLILVR